MTSEQFEPGRWRLSFAEPEALFLMNVLARLVRYYQADVADLSPQLRTFWQTGSSIQDAPKDESSEESREVLADSREELRSDRATLAENWMREFEIAEQRDPWVVELTTEERDEFVCMLNDRRLILAMEAGITEDGRLDPAQIPDEGRRMAVMEIDVLGSFVMLTLGPQIHRP